MVCSGAAPVALPSRSSYARSYPPQQRDRRPVSSSGRSYRACRWAGPRPKTTSAVRCCRLASVGRIWRRYARASMRCVLRARYSNRWVVPIGIRNGRRFWMTWRRCLGSNEAMPVRTGIGACGLPGCFQQEDAKARRRNRDARCDSPSRLRVFLLKRGPSTPSPHPQTQHWPPPTSSA